MRIDAGIAGNVDGVAGAARAAETGGFSTAWIAELEHDPFLQCLQALEATSTLRIGTAIAVAFARSPMTTATTGYDLARYGKGRFILGLGSQIKPHIERRFSMQWSHPAARMREFVVAMRSIWSCWRDGTPLDFRGEFYTHTLMTPMFVPASHQWGPPPVFIAGVGPKMTQVAGEVADGFIFHGFTTERYLHEVTLPALRAARAGAGKTMEGFTVCGPAFLATGASDAEIEASKQRIRKQLAFYASTPAYAPVLELHGWGDLQPVLRVMSVRGKWDEMADLITDEMLGEFAAVGTPDEVAPELVRRFSDVADSISLYTLSGPDAGLLDAMRHALSDRTAPAKEPS
ncbi:MAG TPA: TIGR03617 family F420-dependent LLM class oxidoreductase [Mycobacteriales bacterium]|nr:TIGR03617 family F420-dependent LLM class oxidoreductase [Mycobacteriales bacterium]